MCNPGYRGAYCEIAPACSGILDAAGNCCPGGVLSQNGTCCGAVSRPAPPRLGTPPAMHPTLKCPAMHVWSDSSKAGLSSAHFNKMKASQCTPCCFGHLGEERDLTIRQCGERAAHPCARQGTALDAHAQCCASGRLDACGACDGPALLSDATAACCASGVLDAGGLCCASGAVDECGVCDGQSGSCGLHATLDLQVWCRCWPAPRP